MQGEYKGDYTRDTFHPFKHLTRVLKQQGRVDLDADWNEQTSILLHYLRTLAADLIGPYGGPGNSFAVTAAPGAPQDFVIAPGHYYVDGILCELESARLVVQSVHGNDVTLASLDANGRSLHADGWVQLLDKDGVPVPGRQTRVHAVSANRQTVTLQDPVVTDSGQMLAPMVTYLTQPDLPKLGRLSTQPALTSGLLYLDVWERHLTCLEDDAMREVALGGPDTAARAKIVWQVKLAAAVPDLPLPDGRADDPNWSRWVARWQPVNRGLLKARVQPQTASNDPCTTAPSSKYRGAENQLYRVEIHGPSGAEDNGVARPATFKWSRENGSVVFPIRALATASSQTTLTLANLGRDQRLSLTKGDRVEIVDDDLVLANRAGRLLKVLAVDPVNRKVTLDGVEPLTATVDAARHPLLRRWDQQDGDASTGGGPLAEDGAVPIREGREWLALEDGIQVQFQPGATYRTGDYWLIPARVATGDIEWPRLTGADGLPALDGTGQPLPAALPPHGVEHHYAPLAALTLNAAGAPGAPADLRRTLNALAS